MVRSLVSSALTLSAFVLLVSGCVGSGASNQSATPKDSTAATAQADENTGGLSGRVIDDENLPVADAILQLAPVGATATSALDGTYTFSNVPPGKYSLFAAKLGYQSSGSVVEIVAGAVAEKIVTLSPLPVAEPWADVMGPYQGYMQCRMSTVLSSGYCGFLPVVGNTPAQQLWINDKVLWDFGKFKRPDWQNLVFESRWTPSTAATNPNMMQVFSYSNRTGTEWWADSGSQKGPIKLVYVRNETGPGGQLPSGVPQQPTMKHTLRTWITLPFGTTTAPAGLAYDMRFQMMVTVFYSESAPETYTALPDS